MIRAKFHAALALVLYASSATLAQTTFTEVEPNGNKTVATNVTISTPGDKLTGTTTGTTSDATSTAATTADYWHIKTAPLPQGLIYRHVLTIGTVTAGTFTHTLRGFGQNAGVLTSIDVAAFSSTASSSTNRSVSWYGFGKEEEIYYAVTGTSTSTQAYVATYTRATTTPIVASGMLNAGPVTCRVRNVSGSLNTDCWLYDSSFNPLANDASGPGGADGSLVAGSPSGTLSSFTRTLGAGTYYLAIGGSNLANNQLSAAADTAGFSQPVLQFPNEALCGVSTGAAATYFADFLDAAGHTVTSANVVLVSWAGNINWVQFTITDPNAPSAVMSTTPNPLHRGRSAAISLTVTPSNGAPPADIASASADISALTSTPPTTINLSSSDGGATWTGTAPVDAAATEGFKSIPFTVVQGGSLPGTLISSGTVTVGPDNDTCADAVVLAAGSPASGYNNSFAGTNDGPIGACQTLSGKGIWYKFTPAVTASYQCDTCGSAFNTVLTIYQIGDCSSTATWTQSGCNDDRPAGTCAEAQTSAAQNVGMVAGTTYYFRVEGFNNGGGIGSGAVVVTATQTGTAGACCSNATGVCSFVGPSSCLLTVNTYAEGVLCSPSPCTIVGACCNNTTGLCTTLGPAGACGAGTTASAALSCSPTPCAIAGSCCNNSTGVCSQIFGGTCPAGSTAGVNSACDASSCPIAGACCVNSSGVCSQIYGGTCPSGSTPGVGTTCGASTCPIAGSCCNNSSGTCSLVYGGSCPSGSTAGINTACDASTCPIAGTCCNNTTGACSLIYGGSCPSGSSQSANLGVVCDSASCPAPINDFCADAISLTVGATSTPVFTGLATGGTANDGPGSCAGPAITRAVWYKVTPSTTAAYRADTCGSGYDTVLTVFTIDDCANTATWTQVGCNDQATTSCPDLNTSAVLNLALTGGTTYHLRVHSFTSTAAGNARVTVTQTGALGACCNNSDGMCTTAAPGACVGTKTYMGDNVMCSASPCVVTAVCCNNTSGACAPTYGGACLSGTTAGSGLTCEPATCGVVHGACCNQGGACTMTFSTECAALAQPGTFLGVAVACPGTQCFGEYEPNSDTFAMYTNNPATLSNGDAIAGIATGGNFDTALHAYPNGTLSNLYVDLWLVGTTPAAPGIYRHELTMIAGSVTQGYGIRGLGQSGGAPTSGNLPIQGSSGASKLTVWYGFGKGEKVILEPFSGTSTPYVLKLADTPVTPTVAAGALAPGAVTIRVVNTGANVIDSDTWLYDGNFNALTNGADGPGGADGQLAAGDPAGTTTSFTRTLPAGTYYLAVSPANLANDQPNDPAEGISATTGTDTRFLTYHPDVVLCGRMNQTTDYTCHVELADAASGSVVSPDITWTSTWNGQVNFVQFTVGAPSTVTCCRGATCQTNVPAGACVSSPVVNAVAISASCTGNTAAGCCFADFDKNGVKSIDDIFIFLNAWFTGSIYTDVSGNGAGAPGIDDIFIFLNDWFAGCT